MSEQSIHDTTADLANNRQFVFRENTGVGSLTANLDQYLHSLTVAQHAAHMVLVFSHCSDATGGYAQMRPEYHYIPVMMGTDGRMVSLYHFVEVLDEVIDYDLVIAELPHLSYAQVGGAISFLRKIVQLNPRDIDIDALEDAETIEDPLFMDELKKALADKETSRVLNRD